MVRRLWVTDDQGQEFKGKIHTIAADGLSMLVDGKSVDVGYDRIVRIDHPHDSLANGALIGSASAPHWDWPRWLASAGAIRR